MLPKKNANLTQPTVERQLNKLLSWSQDKRHAILFVDYYFLNKPYKRRFERCPITRSHVITCQMVRLRIQSPRRQEIDRLTHNSVAGGPWVRWMGAKEQKLFRKLGCRMQKSGTALFGPMADKPTRPFVSYPNCSTEGHNHVTTYLNIQL